MTFKTNIPERWLDRPELLPFADSSAWRVSNDFKSANEQSTK